MLVKRKVRLF